MTRHLDTPPGDESQQDKASRLSRSRAQRRRRRRRWIVAGVVVLLLCGLTAAAVIIAPRLGSRLVRKRVIPALEKRFGRKIEVGRMRGGLNRLVLWNVKVRGPLDCPGKALMHAERVTVTYAFWPLLRGELALRSLTVERPRFCLRRLADGTDNVTDLILKLARRRLSRRIQLKLTEIELKRGALLAWDDRRHLRLRAPALTARLVPGGESTITLQRIWLETRQLSPLQAQALTVHFRTRRGRFAAAPRVTFRGARLRLHDRLVLTDMGGTVSSDKGWVTARLHGGYGDVEQTLWKASGRARLKDLWTPHRAAAELKLNAERFSLDKLAPILPAKLIPDPSRAELSANLDLKLAQGKLTFSGRAALSGLTVRDPYLSRLPVENLGFEGRVRGVYHMGRDLLKIEQAQLKRRRLELNLTAEVLRLRRKPRIKIALEIPRTRCANVLDAIPEGMKPRLAKFAVQGWFDMRLQAEADFHYLTTSSVYLGGQINARQCQVTAVPWELSAARLAAPFGHEIHDAGQKFGFEVGPANPDFVPLDEISMHVQNAILTTEDSRFFFHRGFIPHEFQSALAKNLIARRFVFGASSITMQMVKNVLLGREKTLARKLQELILTWYLERHLRKKRIFEIYLNVIEFGPGIFGIGRAASHLFGKAAKDLAPQEAAYLASILPSPKRHYKKFCLQKVNPRWRRWVNRILQIMHRRQRLNASELELAVVSPIQFSDKELGSFAQCMARLDRLRTP
ncbi:MAG: transglycosylase domain-containing protein [bacterium]